MKQSETTNLMRMSLVSCRRGFIVLSIQAIAQSPLKEPRVFAYVPGNGYVGVGQVTEPARPVTEFQVDVGGERKPILEARTPTKIWSVTGTTRSAASTW
jgi:hypothetical protein